MSALFDTAEDHLRNSCAVMARLVAAHGPCTYHSRSAPPFQTLATSIVSQQLSVKAADTIKGRMLAVLPDFTPEGILSVAPETLRGCGLSGAKVRYLGELARRVADGQLDLAAMAVAPDGEALAMLTGVPGIGVWTAQMFLIFSLKRPDVLALGDAGLRRAARLLFGAEGDLESVARPWQPYRSVASWYLWQHLDAAPVG